MIPWNKQKNESQNTKMFPANYVQGKRHVELNILPAPGKYIVIIEINFADIPWLVALNIKIKINPSILDVGSLSNLPIKFLSSIYLV